MRRRIALKKLTRSDLTIFQAQFRKYGSGKQKSINLNANVFIREFYPNLAEVAEEKEDSSFVVNLSVLGPGVTTSQVLPQKITKGESYKNWRLNGKLIPNPDDDGRYDILEEGDLAIMEFIGAASPSSIRMVLLAQGSRDDALFYQSLSDKCADRSMVVLDAEELESAIRIAKSEAVDEHPILDLLDTPDLHEAVLGDPDAIHRLQKRRKSRGVSHEELKRNRKMAQQVGELGEYVLNDYLANQGLAYAWDASVNAVSPFDFSLLDGDVVTRVLDAKSTAGPFENRIFVSLPELLEAVEGSVPYDLYRLYEVRDSHAKLRICRNIRGAASEILESLGSVPAGVRVPGVMIDPSWLPFDAEIDIEIPEDQE